MIHPPISSHENHHLSTDAKIFCLSGCPEESPNRGFGKELSPIAEEILAPIRSSDPRRISVRLAWKNVWGHSREMIRGRDNQEANRISPKTIHVSPEEMAFPGKRRSSTNEVTLHGKDEIQFSTHRFPRSSLGDDKELPLAENLHPSGFFRIDGHP